MVSILYAALHFLHVSCVSEVYLCGSQHLIWNFIQPNTRLSLRTSPVLCIPSLFLDNVIMWREIRGGRAASALMSSCLSLCSSVVRILCLLWFLPTTTCSSARTVSTEVRFPSAAHPIHVCGRASASICACADSCMDVYQRVGVGERPRWKGERGGEGGCWSWGEKEREGGQCAARWESERGKKRKGGRKGRDEEDTATAYRCWRLRQRSAALSGHRKMVSVRGELTVAYNLMFSILDSFSMGNATDRNSRAPLPFLLFSPSIYYPALLLLPRTHVHQTRSHSPVGVRSRRIARV